MTDAAHQTERASLATGGHDKQVRRLAILHDLTAAIIAATNFDELLGKISQESTKLFNACGCVLRLVEDQMLVIKARSGICEDLEPAMPLTEGICGKAISENRTILYNAFTAEASAITLVSKHIKVAMCAPLKIGDTVIGTFSLFDKQASDGTIIPFTEGDLVTLESFASIAAIVIEKSILYDTALAHEHEALTAKAQMEELKDYLQGFIENSPDAMITTDLHGIVTFWNKGSENMFGYRRDETLGRFMPSIPDFLEHPVEDLMNRVQRGETITDIETVRRKEDGRIIDINLTFAPIKDTAGQIIGISLIGRDMTEKKRIEKDLLKKNMELNRLLFISSTMRGTLEVDRLLRMVLTAVTLGDGLGFNRAMLFLVDEDARMIRGAMGVGPATHDEAWEIWSRLSTESKDIQTIMQEIEQGPLSKDSRMDRICLSILIPLEANTIMTRAVQEKKVLNVADVSTEPLSDPVLIQKLGTAAYAVVPLISRDKVFGVLWVDNLYSSKVITDHDIEIVKGFTNHIASAIENARLFEKVARAEQELENIFESISDLLYINSSDYTVQKINRAVVERLGMPASDIIGKKCYEVFHGMKKPFEPCPHCKTVATKQPFVSEIEDPHLGGTFLISSSPLFDKAGGLVGTVHIARDISEIKKLKEKVVAVERMAALGEIAAKVAHEIRNPLLSIGGFARRLEKRLDGDARENAQIITDEVRRLEGILNNTLSFVKSPAAERTETDIGQLLRDVVQLLEPSCKDKGNTITLTVEAGLTLAGHPDRLKEALINIVSNANDATDGGSIILRCRDALTPGEHDRPGNPDVHEILIEIEDNGVGIRQEDLHRIFDPFFTTKPTGTGLGLSITKRIIEEHGGRIEVKRARERGTLFRVYLPL